MPNYADMTLMGHVGRSPEIKEFGDKKLATFSMAVSRRVKGEKVSDWFDVKAWGYNADFVSNYVQKGSAILVAGEPLLSRRCRRRQRQQGEQARQSSPGCVPHVDPSASHGRLIPPRTPRPRSARSGPAHRRASASLPAARAPPSRPWGRRPCTTA